jgi:hypothetical protein
MNPKPSSRATSAERARCRQAVSDINPPVTLRGGSMEIRDESRVFWVGMFFPA